MLNNIRCFLLTLVLLIFSNQIMAASDPKCNNLTDCTFLTIHNNSGYPLINLPMVPIDMMGFMGTWKDKSFYKGYIPAGNTADTLYIGQTMGGMQIGISSFMILTDPQNPCTVFTTVIRAAGIPIVVKQMTDGAYCTATEAKLPNGYAVDVTINKRSPKAPNPIAAG